MKKGILLIAVVVVVIGGAIIWRTGKKTENRGVSTPSSANEVQLETQNQPATPQVTEVDDFPGDKDRDGLPDEKEKELGLSNKEFDTDADGLFDYQEVEVYKTDPKKKDTDGDGYADGYEVLNGFNPAGSGALENPSGQP